MTEYICVGVGDGAVSGVHRNFLMAYANGRELPHGTKSNDVEYYCVGVGSGASGRVDRIVVEGYAETWSLDYHDCTDCATV